ncbi:DMT family transporter [Daeguia caeni]|uniref:DMT family transporter n=1 Tax=Daeguia caeni TaxID=439612 RepID=A0ABV9H5J8_9HYPH
MLGIGLKIASVAIFVCMSTLLKASDGVPVGELVFFRSFFGIFALLGYYAAQGQLAGLFQTRHGFSHFWRGLVGVFSMSFGFFALTRLPLPEAIAINYASPLITVILSAIILHEVVRLYRWSAVFFGLIGVMIILWPRLTVFSSEQLVGYDELIGAVAAFISACLGAVAMLLVRHLVQTERTGTIVVYFMISASVLSLMTMPFGWVMPSGMQWVMLIGAGLCGGIAQILLTECYRYAPMSTIAPFEYTSMLLGLGIGYFAFGDVPTMTMLVGSMIVIAAGSFIIYREHQLSLLEQRREAMH